MTRDDMIRQAETPMVSDLLYLVGKAQDYALTRSPEYQDGARHVARIVRGYLSGLTAGRSGGER